MNEKPLAEQTLEERSSYWCSVCKAMHRGSREAATEHLCLVGLLERVRILEQRLNELTAAASNPEEVA